MASDLAVTLKEKTFALKPVGGYAYFNLNQPNNILVAGTYQKLAGIYNNAILKEFSVIADKLTYLGDETLYMRVEITGNLSFPINNKTVKIAVEHNGVILDSSRACMVYCDVADKPYSYNHFIALEIKKNDTIDFFITCDSTGIVDVVNFSTIIQRSFS